MRIQWSPDQYSSNPSVHQNRQEEIKTQIAKSYIHNLIQRMKPDNLNFQQQVPRRTISLEQGSINFM